MTNFSGRTRATALCIKCIFRNIEDKWGPGPVRPSLLVFCYSVHVLAVRGIKIEEELQQQLSRQNWVVCRLREIIEWIMFALINHVGNKQIQSIRHRNGQLQMIYPFYKNTNISEIQKFKNQSWIFEKKPRARNRSSHTVMVVPLEGFRKWIKNEKELWFFE